MSPTLTAMAPAGLDVTSLSLAVTEHAPLPIVTVEGAGHMVRYANPAFCRLINKSSAQLVGKSFGEILPEKYKCMAALDHVFHTGQSAACTEREPVRPHASFWSFTMWPLMVAASPLGVIIHVTKTAQFHENTLAMNEALVLGAVRQHELTESVHVMNSQLTDHAAQLEREVVRRTAELTATNKQLEAFVYSIAHDLRAPLRSMQGFAAMLVHQAGGSLDEKGRDYARRIEKSAQFMDEMLIDLLAFSRISQQHVELVPIHLQTVVKSVLSHLQKDIQEKNACVESPGPWPILPAHLSTLTQVLLNLVGNALKFSAPGVPPWVRLWSEERSEFIRIWVEDNGIGIAPDHQGQVFQLFTRLEGSKHPGTGLGLAIVQKGVERMGGRTGVESMPGQGSRFWFELRGSP